MRKRACASLILSLVVLIGGAAVVVCGQGAEEEGAHMHVHSAASGTLIAVEGAENVYTLTLHGVSPQTGYHTDYPEHITGHVDTGTFLDSLGAGESRTAVIELMDGAEGADVLPVQLSDPTYDPVGGTLQYKAEIVSHDGGPKFLTRHAGEELTTRADETLPETFGNTQVYVDSPPSTASARLPIIIPAGFRLCYPLLACVEGMLFIAGADTYADARVTLFGHDALSVRLDPGNSDYHVEAGPLKASVEFTVTSVEPAHGKISLRGCYWALKWHCQSATVVDW